MSKVADSSVNPWEKASQASFANDGAPLQIEIGSDAIDLPLQPKMRSAIEQSLWLNALIGLIGIVLIATIWDAAFSQIQRERSEAIATVVKLNTNLAIAFEEYTTRTIKSVDSFTQYLELEYRRRGLQTNIVQTMEDLGIDKDFIANVAIVDEHGKPIVCAFSPRPIVPINVSDLDHFKVHVAQNLGESYVGRPILSRIYGKLAIPITRRINKADGSFGGVVMVQIEPSYFTKFYHESSNLQPDVIALLGLDGIVRAQRRGQNETSGEDISSHEIFKELASHSAGEIFNMDQSDGIFRYISYRTLREYPVMVMVGTSELAVSEALDRRKTGYFWTASLVSLLIASIVFILIMARIRQAHIVSTLRDSETRFRILIESLPQLVWICRPDGRAVYFNQKWIDFSGTPLTDNYGYGWQRILHRDDHKRLYDVWQSAIKSGEPFNVEYRLRRADGQFRWMLVRGTPMHDKRGNANYWLGTCTDIDDQKHIEQALHESERFTRATIDALSQHIAVLNEAGNILAVNNAWKAFATTNGSTLTSVSEGYNYLEVCRRAALAGDPDAAAVIELIADVSTGKKNVATMEYSCHSATEQRWFTVRITRFDNATPLRLVVAHENVTERKIAEARINFQAHLLDTVGQAVIATDLQGAITYWNKFSEKLYGWTFSEVAGKNIADVTKIAASQKNELSSALQAGEAWSGELEVENRDGLRFFAQVANTPILDTAGKLIGIVGISYDLTQRKLFEQRLRDEEQRFKAISTNIPGMVFQLQKKNSEILFTYISDGATDVCGIEATTLLAQPTRLIDLLDEISATSFFQSMECSAKHLHIWNWEGKLKLDQCEHNKWVNLRATPRHAGPDCVLWDGVIFNITETKIYEASLEEKRGLLQDLSAHQVAVKEEERKRIAREIHDELGQRLTVLRMDVLMLRKQPEAQSQDIQDVIDRMRDSIDDVLRIIRNIASALRPAALDIGFVMAVEWLIEEFQTSLKIPCTFNNLVADSISLDDECATGIFRILQESLTNITRHAKASHIEVTLERDGRYLLLEVRDDGVGFNEEHPKNTRSYGLVGMRERAAMLNGEIAIHSTPGAGTAVQLRIPI